MNDVVTETKNNDGDEGAEQAAPHLQLIVLCGLQAAGKSTFYRKYFAQTHVLVSKDLLGNNKRPAVRQRQLLGEALQGGRSVVVDNTNVTRAERAELVGLGKEYEAEVMCYYFPLDVKRSLEQNRQRSGKARVPDVALFASRKRFEVPEWDEGFDRFYTVGIVEGGEFAVALVDH